MTKKKTKRKLEKLKTKTKIYDMKTMRRKKSQTQNQKTRLKAPQRVATHI